MEGDSTRMRTARCGRWAALAMALAWLLAAGTGCTGGDGEDTGAENRWDQMNWDEGRWS